MLRSEYAKGEDTRYRELFVVKDGDTAIGLLMKYRDTMKYRDIPAKTYPWQAYLGTGRNLTFLGNYYESDSFAATTQDVMIGGRKAALLAIADARHATSGKVPAGIDFDTP